MALDQALNQTLIKVCYKDVVIADEEMHTWSFLMKQKPMLDKFKLEIRQNVGEWVSQWNMLPREMVKAPSHAVFKSLDVSLIVKWCQRIELMQVLNGQESIALVKLEVRPDHKLEVRTVTSDIEITDSLNLNLHLNLRRGEGKATIPTNFCPAGRGESSGP